MANIPASVYITHLERENTFIKVWGQTDRSLPIAIEKALQQMTPQFEQGMYSPAIENFQVGIMCCAKFKDDLYYRARITSINYLTQGMVEVLFIDYGNRDIISCMNTRTMSGLQTGLISIPPQAKDFILANVVLQNWDLHNFEMICRELRYLEFQLVPILEVGPHTLISLYSNKQDMCESLVERGLLLKIPLQLQQLSLQSSLQQLIARNAPPGLPVPAHQLPIAVSPMQPKIAPITQPVPTPTLLTYKALPLDNESEHQIYVSYVSDGPCLFSVQLKKMEEQLKRLMTEINCMELQPLEEYPLPGTVCLAQSSEDGYICRAVVTSMVDGQYKVFYVDFGNTELLPFDKLFQIPFKYVIPKVMATRFALAGLENATVSIEMKCKFKEFVNNRPLYMKVKPAATKSALPLCELWDENGIKALDMIKQAALLSYPEAAPLSRGVNQDVKVCFVYSCNKIFVQLKTKENDLKQLMNSLQQTCHSRPLFNINDVKIGAPCCAIFVDDSMWYRAEILQIDSDSIRVKYVDFGNENIVRYNDIKVPLPEHITALRPQAIECCLNGYQNIEPDEQRDILLEELILEQVLSMRVVEIQGSRALVDLYDKHHYNVASLLLEKIANTTSMVSPLLIQDNHRIEHRKRSPPQGNQRDFREKKPLREVNDRNRDNRQENWRQNKFSRNDEKNKSFTPNKHNFFQRRNNRNNSDDNWNDQLQTQKQDKFQKTNNRNNEPDWEEPEESSSENRNSFHHGNKRFDEQRGKNFASRDNSEQSSNDDWNENKNLYPRGGKRNTFNGKGGNRSDGDNRSGFEKRDGLGKRDAFERKDGFEKKNNYQRRDGFERKEGAKRDGFERKEGFGKRDGFERKESFSKRDGFERKEGFGKRDGFEKKEGFKKFNRNQSSQDYGKSNRNFNDSRSSDEGSIKAKNRDFKKDGSEKSWSDASERSWRKGPRTFSKQRDFGNSHKLHDNETALQNDTWNTGTASTSDSITYDYASETDRFQTYPDLSGSDQMISISWFYNPINFYCQLDNNKLAFKEMMEEIQLSYRNRKTTKANPGSPVIVPFSEDGALYRAEVLSSQFNQYRVKYVDYGNVATVAKVYPIEKKYMNLPAQAIPCGLQGIASLNDTWPDPDTFSSYFDKDSFSCQFISFLENRYYVELNYKGESISTQLNKACLAVAVQPITSVDIHLLVNQQIMVVLKDVVSLNNITIEVQSGVTVNAAMHNLTTATETYEDNLKQWIGHYLIMYVDEVLENQVEITLYDLTGQKLQVVSPDEGAYDTVEPLCPLPIYSNVIQGFVSYASAESIYVQPSKFSQTIAQLSETLHGHYSVLQQEETITPIEGQIYAVLSSDSNWYRGSVTEIKGSEVVITFVDYGNTELVPTTNLRELSPLFYQPHMLAVEIFVPEDKEQYLEQEITVSVVPGSLGWEGTVILESDADTDVIAPQTTEVLTELEEAVTTFVSPQQDFTLEEEEEEAASPTIGVHVVISHIDTPSEFYLQHSDASESISLLQEELQEHIPNLSNLENPTAGVLCAAPYSVCQQWFRAQVLDADDDITTVRFVDFGNTDVITNSNVHVKTLPTEMLSIEYHAKLCSLFAKPIGEEWSAAAIDAFENYVSVENLTAEIIHQDEKTTYVELYADGKNVAEMLKEEGLATDLHLEIESSSTGFISHLNSPSEFWIQLESSCSDLEWVADQLANADSYPALEDLTPGSLCAAIFSDDDSWYRARILSNTVAGLEVIFIDYGNSCSCNGLRELPEDLIMLPPLALKCSLQKPNGILQWSQEATEKFKEISADGATVFKVNILTTGETSIVQLTHGGQDISTRLVPETRQCFVSVVDSVDSFWVQFMDDNAKIENMVEALELAESWPEVTDAADNSLVAALFVDEVWYRAKILGKSTEGYETLFIDYGNTALVTNLKQLPDEYAKIEPLATNFKLDMLPRTKWGNKSDELFKSMTECGVAMFDLELVSENIARLYLNGADIRPSLEYIKCTPVVSLQSSPKKMLVETESPKIAEHCSTIMAETITEVNDIAIDERQSVDMKELSHQDEENIRQDNSLGQNVSTPSLQITEQTSDIKNVNGITTADMVQNHLESIIDKVSRHRSEDTFKQNESIPVIEKNEVASEINNIHDVTTAEIIENHIENIIDKVVISSHHSSQKLNETSATNTFEANIDKNSTKEDQKTFEAVKIKKTSTEQETNKTNKCKTIETDQNLTIQETCETDTLKITETDQNSTSQEISETNTSKTIEIDQNSVNRIVNDNVEDSLIGSCQILSEKGHETSPLETSVVKFDATKCDIINQETLIHQTDKPVDSLVVKDIRNEPTNSSHEVINTLKCDRTVEISETNKKCTESSSVITEASDTGHSPRKDKITENIKLEEEK
ncbi:putative tudor domain protein [Trypoxylus dichotomus]